MSKKLFFEIENTEVIDDNNNSQFATARILAFSSGDNRHDMICSEETLRKTAHSLYDKPIIYSIEKTFNDFASHAEPDKTLIAGFVIPNSAEFNMLGDGRLGLYVVAKIWKMYSPKVIELFQEKKNKKISVEMTLDEYNELPNGKIEMLGFSYYGICILGDLYTEASPGANIEMVSFASENQKVKDAYNLEFSKYGKLDFAISDGIKIASKEGLDLAHGNGAKSVDLAIANYLIKNKFATPDRIKRLYSKFSKFSKDDLIDKNGKKWITWQLLGGEDCFQWVKLLFEQMNEIEKISKEDFMKKDKDGKPIGEEEEAPEGEPQTTMAEEKPEEMPMKEEEMAVEEEKPKEEEMAAEPEEEAKEEEEQEEEKKEEMSLDAYLDVGATLALLQQETEGFKELVPEAVFTATELFSMLFEKYKVVATENVELKEFKSDVEKQQFDFAVDSTLKEIESSVEIPSEEIESLRTMSVDFSIETIDGWKNAAYAKAFTFAKKGDEDGDPIHKYAVGGLYGVAKSKKGLWD